MQSPVELSHFITVRKNLAVALCPKDTLAGVLLSLSATLLFRHMMWSGANILLALGATLLAAGASTVHYLARPHIFTFVGLTVSKSAPRVPCELT